LSHLCLNANILPRQARDKHRESTQKTDRFTSVILSHAVRKISFLRCILNLMLLKNQQICQARDEHMFIAKLEKTHSNVSAGTCWRFLRCSRSRMWRRTLWCLRARNGASIWRTLRLSSTTTLGPSLTSPSAKVLKNGLFEPFIYKNEHFTKTGSGQLFETQVFNTL
jgi:hypothetical protein